MQTQTMYVYCNNIPLVACNMLRIICKKTNLFLGAHAELLPCFYCCTKEGNVLFLNYSFST